MSRAELITVLTILAILLGAVVFAFNALRTATDLHNDSVRIYQEVHKV